LQHDNFDPQALQILLHIIHGKTRMIPRFIDLEMMAKVAVLLCDALTDLTDFVTAPRKCFWPGWAAYRKQVSEIFVPWGL
jgi:hypothetical protein